MLKYNFDRIFKAKGIERPFTFLRNAGYSDNFASKIKNGRVNRLSLNLLERLCLTMGCTPNDFLEWNPDKDQQIDEAHPLMELKREDKVLSLTRMLNSMPLSKLVEIEKMIDDKQDK